MDGKLIVFIDTNIFLHYQPFAQIPWAKLLNHQDICIILPTITIAELNKHKDLHPKANIKQRAKSIMDYFLRLFEAENEAKISENIKIILDPTDNSKDFFDLHRLNYDVADDHLIATALVYRERYPNSQIMLVTSDNGLALTAKARPQNIQTYQLEDIYRIPSESTEEEKELKRLKQENEALKNRIPKLSLTFENKEIHLLQSLTIPDFDDNRFVSSELLKIQEENPKKILSEANNNLKMSQLIQLGVSTWLSADQINQYNSELDIFYHKYQVFLQEVLNYKYSIEGTLCLKILLVNDGTALAENIDIVFKLPLHIKPSNIPPQKPIKPLPPPQPTSFYTIPQIDISSFTRASSFTYDEGEFFDIVHKEDAFLVGCHVGQLKHHHKEHLDDLFLTFTSSDNIKSFQIEYQITTNNNPQPIFGQLNVRVEKNLTPQEPFIIDMKEFEENEEDFDESNT